MESRKRICILQSIQVFLTELKRLYSLQPVIDYIDSKFEDYLNTESCTNRHQMPDNRVQCCLSFIAPSGHGLKPLDIEFMKRLHEKVNIIPLIAKADTLTPEECQQFKKQIMKEIQEYKIKIYEFSETDDEEENKLVKKIKDRLPLAVVGGNTIIEVNSKRVRGRQYPWSVAEAVLTLFQWLLEQPTLNNQSSRRKRWESGPAAGWSLETQLSSERDTSWKPTGHATFSHGLISWARRKLLFIPPVDLNVNSAAPV
ncbi:septin-7-like [Symphalangus syndactylus]|uniref:septin-7-like n=1 Tax=Symphalangus syndactylus TaxID=9590 RepID=UPI003006A272